MGVKKENFDCSDSIKACGIDESELQIVDLGDQNYLYINFNSKKTPSHITSKLLFRVGPSQTRSHYVAP